MDGSIGDYRLEFGLLGRECFPFLLQGSHFAPYLTLMSEVAKGPGESAVALAITSADPALSASKIA